MKNTGNSHKNIFMIYSNSDDLNTIFGFNVCKILFYRNKQAWKKTFMKEFLLLHIVASDRHTDKSHISLKNHINSMSLQAKHIHKYVMILLKKENKYF